MRSKLRSARKTEACAAFTRANSCASCGLRKLSSVGELFSICLHSRSATLPWASSVSNAARAEAIEACASISAA